MSAPTPSLSTAVASAGGLPGHEELGYVLDRVSELEGRLSNIRNELDAPYDEFEERMEAFHAVVEEVVEEGAESAAVDTQENPHAEDCEVNTLGLRRAVTPGSERTLTSLLKIMILRGRLLVNCQDILLNRSSRRAR